MRALWMAVALSLLVACAHSVNIDTVPSGGDIVVDGVALGAGPVLYEEQTGAGREVVIEAKLDGYDPVTRRALQDQWALQLVALSVCGSCALGSPLTVVGALPLVGLMFAHQMPDAVRIPLRQRPTPASTDAVPRDDAAATP